jgi:hypothetical protein
MKRIPEKKVSYSPFAYVMNRLDHNPGQEGSAPESELTVDRFLQTIQTHVHKIRSASGVTQGLQGDPHDIRSDAVFSKMRPQCPYMLSELTSPEFDPKIMHTNSRDSVYNCW